jgi:hypothetical protein
VLTNISLGLPVPVVAALLIPATAARLHEKDTPDVELVGTYPKELPLHTAGGFKELESTGVGLTVTTTFCVLIHPPILKVYM